MTVEMGLLTIVSISSTIVIILFVILVFIYLMTNPYPNLTRSASEEKYYDPIDKIYKLFPKLKDSGSISLSVIVPAYNEEVRLPLMMDEALQYLLKYKAEKSLSFEIIVVDDGSQDRTTEIALQYSLMYTTDVVRVLTLERNRGKGGAVRLGMLSARGKELLFADADGATKFSELENLQDELKIQLNRSDCNMALICGSRAHLEKESIVKRSVFRTVLMYGFHFWVWALCNSRVKDTQCGFKLLSRPTARLLFGNLHVERWAFDVDLLYLANHFRIPVGEVCVSWTEKDGSKLVPVFSWLQMAKDILMIRMRYMLGAWKIEPSHKLE